MAAPFAAVIVAGGQGTRLWPRSRRRMPKHLLDLSGAGRPLVRATYERVRALADEVHVVTEAAQAPLVLDALPGLSASQLILEPSARGTTSALALAAMRLAERDPETVMMSLPADHVVIGEARYAQAVRRAARVARASDSLVLVGLRPTHPSTALGYIEAHRQVRIGGATALRVDRFVEKPSPARAASFLADGRHFWNLAMFCFRVAVFLQELERHAPGHFRGVSEVVAALRAGDERGAARLYSRLSTEAVDYTVMERSDRLLLVPAGFRWADVGSWPEVAGVLNRDSRGNVVEGEAELIDTDSSLLLAPGKLVAAIGVSDLIVVDTPDALLVCHMSRAQDVKKLVDALSRGGKIKYL